MTEFYPGDTYITPANVRKAFTEYLLLGSRWSPYSYFIKIILTYRPLALRGEYDDEMWAFSSYQIMKYLERCGAKFEIAGMDRIRALTGPAVFVANHMSTLETLALPGLIRPIRPVTFVVKRKLVNGFFWGPIMRSRNPIVVDQKDIRADLETVLREGAERLSRGISVIIFPEGTRAETFDRSHFNSLAIKLASRAGVPVIPVAVKTDYWSNSPLLRGFGPIHRDRPVHIEFGEPMTIEGRGKAEHEKTVEFIESRLRAWGGKITEPGAT